MIHRLILALTIYVFGWLPLAAQTVSLDVPAREADALAGAMAAVRAEDWAEAQRLSRRAGQIGQDIVEWHRLRASAGSFDDTRAFLSRRGDWPGLPFLQTRSEGAVPFGQRALDVIDFFAAQEPRTGGGAVALSEAYRVAGQSTKAQDWAIRAWTEFRLSPADEQILLGRYGDVLAPLHEARLDMLIWGADSAGAERMFPRVSSGWRALARARLALRSDRSGVDSLINAVPASLRSHPGLVYERFRWRAEKSRNGPAVELALSVGAEPEDLGRPEAWANWRQVLARWALRQGSAQDAYDLASAHGLTEGSAYADLEWLAGYVALRQLDDAQTALFHFQRFRVAVASPISLGRAGYWEGRAYEALGQTDQSEQAYRFAAEHQTSFYGQLAAERAGIEPDPSLRGLEKFPDWQNAAFVNSSVFEAGLLLAAAGERALAERFMAHLAESLNRTETGQLADVAFALEDPHMALTIAKRGVQYGNLVQHAYYPVVDLGVDDLDVPPELALAIARRESEFDPGAISGVGARGLMQIMPRTAQEVARGLSLPYSRDRLLSDPEYNALLGTTYLADLIETFGDNYVLVSAGYNAGPSRPIRWIDAQGDPRTRQTDAVDWIESIPFTETRNYVMRVMESLAVYRARLTGRVEPLALTQELSQR